MQAILTTEELDIIAAKVAARIQSMLVADTSHKELQAQCESFTKKIISFYLSQNAINVDVAKQIGPTLDDHLKATNIVTEHLKSYLNSDHFKILELHHLKQRVYDLERELDDKSEG